VVSMLASGREQPQLMTEQLDTTIQDYPW
jgi:hypothetical protein